MKRVNFLYRIFRAFYLVGGAKFHQLKKLIITLNLYMMDNLGKSENHTFYTVKCCIYLIRDAN